MFEIREDDLSSLETRALLALHLEGMRANSPPGNVFALNLSGLQLPEVTVWTAWRQGRVAGVGALKMLGDGSAEVKSMRTHPDFLRQGAGAAILDEIIATATARGVQLLSLEIGSGAAFEPALALLSTERLQPVPAPRAVRCAGLLAGTPRPKRKLAWLQLLDIWACPMTAGFPSRRDRDRCGHGET